MNKEAAHIDPILTGKYLSGETKPEETRQIEAWINYSEQHRDEFEKFRKLWEQAGITAPGEPAPVNLDIAWAKLKNRISGQSQAPVDITEEINIHRRRKNSLFILSRVAAMLVIGVLIYTAYEWIIKPVNPVEIAARQEIREMSLPDQSEVTLNKNSVITYPKKFAGEERRVELKGEAYFQVEKNKEKPFVIEVPDALIRVFGTSFNVRAFEGDPEVTVTVKEGEVSLSDKDDIAYVILGPNEKGILNRSTGHIEKYIATDESDLFWRTRTLVFRDTPLEKVFDTLSKIYDVKITTENNLILRCTLTGKFQDLKVDEILENISLSFDLKVKKTPEAYEITGDGC